MPLLLGLLFTGVIAFLIWWLIFESEGVYLGRRMVVWLYDVYATRYDNIKEFDLMHDHLLISEPILARIQPHNDPLVLDVATGTGRLPLTLCYNANFEGHVIGIDLSRKMLEQAEQKILAEHFEDFVTLMQENAQELPFQDDVFDVVTCLEALEFMPSPDAVLQEMIRVLRPGGLLLTTLRINMHWMPGRTWSENQMREKLTTYGMIDISFEIWQEDYTKVWGRKVGESEFVGARPIEDIIAQSSKL